MTEVTLVQTHGFSELAISSAVYRTFDLVGMDLSNITSVVIKPNLSYYWDYSTGETTDPRVVSAIIDYLKMVNSTLHEIVIAEADASAMKTRNAFTMLGYEDIAATKHVKLVNLCEGNILQKTTVVGSRTITLNVNSLLLEADLIINVPKLKYHRFTGMTGALKNMFGAIAVPRKSRYHPRIAETIIAMNQIVRSHITIMDGVIVLGKYPKKIGVLLGCLDPLAIDCVAAQLFGYNPPQLPYLQLAIKTRGGKMPPITVHGDTTIEKVSRMIPKRNYKFHNFLWDIQIKALHAYQKIVGDVIPPLLQKL